MAGPVDIETIELTKATPEGPPPTGTVATTVFVAISITEMLPLSSFVTYAKTAAPALLTRNNNASADIPKAILRACPLPYILKFKTEIDKMKSI